MVLDSYERPGKGLRIRQCRPVRPRLGRFLQHPPQSERGSRALSGEPTLSENEWAICLGAAPGAPGEELLELETLFDRVQPFQWAWILMLASLLLFTTSLALGSRIFYAAGWMTFAGSLGFQLFGFFTRVTLSGRPPVSNMYETVIWVSFMSSIFALILELIYRRTVIILAGTLVATLGLVLADQLPLALDPRISPLLPVLRSNYWLTIHVLTIVSSYAGGTLAWGLGNIALTMFAFGTPRTRSLKTLSKFTYRAIQIAVLLLAAGTFLGGWWAADSWGRFWGWDPKEVWALIALVCYVIPLHMRYIGWVKDFGLAVAAVLCYAAIVMSWYGVNFVLGAGLHSYGFGGGGPWWVFGAGLLNIEYVLVCSLLYLNKTTGGVSVQPGMIPCPQIALSPPRRSESISSPGARTTGFAGRISWTPKNCFLCACTCRPGKGTRFIGIRKWKKLSTCSMDRQSNGLTARNGCCRPEKSPISPPTLYMARTTPVRTPFAFSRSSHRRRSKDRPLST